MAIICFSLIFLFFLWEKSFSNRYAWGEWDLFLKQKLEKKRGGKKRGGRERERGEGSLTLEVVRLFYPPRPPAFPTAFCTTFSICYQIKKLNRLPSVMCSKIQWFTENLRFTKSYRSLLRSSSKRKSSYPLLRVGKNLF